MKPDGHGLSSGLEAINVSDVLVQHPRHDRSTEAALVIAGGRIRVITSLVQLAPDLRGGGCCREKKRERRIDDGGG
jgi:hypothetical protein